MTVSYRTPRLGAAHPNHSAPSLGSCFGLMTPFVSLSPNYFTYIAKDTADIARALGLTLLFTPVRSPESNGISESFVKTLKRDYARLNILHDADAILAMLPNWIEDYCEIHPHSGLKFRSPREFIRLSA